MAKAISCALLLKSYLITFEFFLTWKKLYLSHRAISFNETKKKKTSRVLFTFDALDVSKNK